VWEPCYEIITSNDFEVYSLIKIFFSCMAFEKSVDVILECSILTQIPFTTLCTHFFKISMLRINELHMVIRSSTAVSIKQYSQVG